MSTGWSVAVGPFVRGRSEAPALMRCEAFADGGGEEVVPGGVGAGEPAGGGVLEEELEGGAVFSSQV